MLLDEADKDTESSEEESWDAIRQDSDIAAPTGDAVINISFSTLT